MSKREKKAEERKLRQAKMKEQMKKNMAKRKDIGGGNFKLKRIRFNYPDYWSFLDDYESYVL